MVSDRTVFVVMLNGDPAVRDSIAALISSIGHEVQIYDSGEDFQAANQTGQQGCLVIDLNSIDPNAVRFIEGLAGAGFELPVIVTADDERSAADMPALPASVIALLQKPFVDEHLADVIECALAAASIRNTTRA